MHWIDLQTSEFSIAFLYEQIVMILLVLLFLGSDFVFSYVLKLENLSYDWQGYIKAYI